MADATILRRGALSVVDYRCTAGPSDAPFVERHGSFAVSYVRKGSFGYRLRGQSFELVAGSVLKSIRHGTFETFVQRSIGGIGPGQAASGQTAACRTDRSDAIWPLPLRTPVGSTPRPRWCRPI